MGRIGLIVLKGIGHLYFILPRRLQFYGGAALGWILLKAGFRKSIVEQNLRTAFPDQPPQTQMKLTRSSYEHLGHLIFEVMMIFGPMKKFVEKRVSLQGAENLREAEKKGKGVIFLSSHVGNWEIMAATGVLLAKADLLLVTKRLKPVWLHEAIEKARKFYGVRATYEPRTLRDVLADLKKNKAVGFVLDQYAGPPIGVRVPLFGLPVGTSAAVAALAKRTGAVVLPVENYRRPDGDWDVIIYPPLEWKKSNLDMHSELALNTAHYVAVLEKHILHHPDQWLWTHRRFKGDLSPLREGEWSEARVRS